MAVVATLRVAPVKGLATVPTDRVHVEHAGVAGDRRLFVLDERGSVVTLRSHPQLVQVVPELDLDRGVLSVTLPDGVVVSSPLDDARAPVQAHLFGKDRSGRLLPGGVTQALSEVAGEPVRLVLGEAGVGWDEGPVSILGRASAVAVGAGRDRARYRMLVEIDGTEPFEEDSWIGRELQLGEARVTVTHALVRCVIITQSPMTGEKDWNGLHALAEMRGRDRLCLGVIAEVVQPGEISVGADVTPVPAG